MKRTVLRMGGIALLVMGFGATGFAALGAPEIDPTSGMNALALVAGALMILRSRVRR